MIETRTLSGVVRVQVARLAAPLPAPIETRVRALWEEAVRARGSALFNGSIVSVIGSQDDLVQGEITDYRRVVAQHADPELRSVLAVRPLAVSGLLRCADGVVFGRRSAGVTESGGCWELAPAGGVDGAGLAPGDVLDPAAQVLAELTEELGVPGSSVHESTPFCLVDDDRTGVVDIGIELHAPVLTIREVIEAHQRVASDEYDDVTVVDESALAAFVAEHPDLVPVSGALLGARGLL